MPSSASLWIQQQTGKLSSQCLAVVHVCGRFTCAHNGIRWWSAPCDQRHTGSMACALRSTPCRAPAATSFSPPLHSCGLNNLPVRPLVVGPPNTALGAACGLLRQRCLHPCILSPATAALRSRLGAQSIHRGIHASVFCLSSALVARACATEPGAPPRAKDAAPGEDHARAAMAAKRGQPTGQVPSSGPRKTSAVDYTTLLACCSEVEVPARVDQVGGGSCFSTIRLRALVWFVL